MDPSLRVVFQDSWGDDRPVAYKMLQDLHNIFQENNIDYFLVSGTLLGQVRHGDLIPWDDDMDVMIHHRDVPALCGLVLADYTITMDYYYHLYKFRRTNTSFPYIDIFVCRDIISTDTYMFYHKHFPKEHIYPLVDASLGPCSVRIPQDPQEVLYRIYNKTCLLYCKSPKYSHRGTMQYHKVYTVPMNKLYEYTGTKP